MNIVVVDVGESIEKIADIAERLGGFPSSRSSTSSPDSGESAADWRPRSGSITVRVPAQSFRDLRASVRDLAKYVQSDSDHTEDVTERFFDAQSRIKSLEAATARLNALIDKASDADSIARLMQQSTSLTERLESLKGQLRHMTDAASLSTLTVHLSVPSSTPVTPPPTYWSPLRTAFHAAQQLGALARSIVDMFVWVGVLYVPPALVLGLVGWAIVSRLPPIPALRAAPAREE